MEHAEAHERLSDLALEPRRLATLAGDPSPEAVELRGHLAGCDRCAANLAGWLRTWAELGHVARTEEMTAAADGIQRSGIAGLGAGPVVEPPAVLRDRVLAGARKAREPGPDTADASGSTIDRRAAGTRQPEPIRRRPSRPWLVAAAAILVAVLAGTNSYLRTAELGQLQAQNAELAQATATLDRVLAADRFWTVTLRTADGTPGGTLAWSAQEVVVITSGLPAPGPAQGYRCWLEREGSRTAMGWMAFSRTTGYWAASMSEYPSGALRPGGRFGVSLVPAGGGGTPVLVGEL